MTYPLHPQYQGQRPVKPPFRKNQKVRDLETGAEGAVAATPYVQETFAPTGQNPQDENGGTFLFVEWLVPVDWGWGVSPVAAGRLGPLE